MGNLFRWENGKLVAITHAADMTAGQKIVSKWAGSWAFVVHTPEQLTSLAAMIDGELTVSRDAALDDMPKPEGV